ncbi:MAG: GNAT family N-acetyltransferase [Cypionkella sp.]
MFHRTERLFLRPAWPEDWQAILCGIADEGIVRHLARAPWPYGPAEARAYAEVPQDPGRPHFMVVEADSGQLVGSVGIGEHRGEAEIGYWIARASWGRGYATEAAAGVLEIARLLGYRRVHAGHFVDNPASGRVLRKLGFVPTGITRPRMSCARGEAVLAHEYTLDLDPGAAARAQAA